MDVDAVLAELFALISRHLTEKQRRLLLGAGARALGRGGGARMAPGRGNRPDLTARHGYSLGPLYPGYRQRLTGKSLLAYPRRVSDMFKALADDTRRKILDELIERDGQTLFEICSRLAMKYGLGSSRQAISQHLEVLESAGLVTSRREGRYKFHSINTKPLEQIVDRWLRADTEETR